MPNRIIKESIVTSNTLAQLTGDEERLFWRLVVLADDYGRFHGDSVLLRPIAFPRLIDRISQDDFDKWLRRLEEVGLIRFYEVDGKRYLYITGWDKHQSRRAMVSKFPAPPFSAPKEHPLPTETDIEDVVFSGLEALETFLGGKILALDRQVRVGESYLDIVLKTDLDTFVLELKRGSITPKAVEQLKRYLSLVPGKGILIGNRLAANLDLEACSAAGIAVVCYSDALEWKIVSDAGFLSDIPWATPGAVFGGNGRSPALPVGTGPQPGRDAKSREITCSRYSIFDIRDRERHTTTTDRGETAVSSPPPLSAGNSSVCRSVEDTPTGEMAAEATAAMAEVAAATQEDLPLAYPEAIPTSLPPLQNAEIAAMEEAAAEIAATWERVIGAAISPVQAELLGAEAMRRGRDVILYAIEVTARARDAGRIRGSPMAYLTGILRTWDGLRLTNLDAILAHEAQRQAGQQSQEEADPPPRKGRLKRYLHADLPGGYMDVWVQ